jgi:hypothetical protein
LRKIKIAFAFSALLYVCILNWKCTKIDTTSAGAGLIPAVDNVFTFADTLAVIATNYDSTGGTASGGVFGTLGCDSLSRHRLHVFGTISNGQDPLFGSTTAAIYFQVLPATLPYHFAAPTRTTNDTILGNAFDSVVLQLHYKKTWGDSANSIQTMNIYQLNVNSPNQDIFKFDSTYKTCDPPPPTGPLLKTISYKPADFNNISVSLADSATNQLRINLTSQLGALLYDQDSTNNAVGHVGHNGYYNDSTFKSIFGGFALIPGSTGKALSYFDLDGQNTRLAIYYRYKKYNINTGKNDTLSTVSYFRLGLLAGERNLVTRDHSGAEISAHQTHPAAGDDLIYIQTSPGTFATLKIPGLNGYPNRIIHRAELVIDQVTDNVFTDSLFRAPDYLFLEEDSSSSGKYRPIPCDFLVSGGIPDIGTFGGYKSTFSDASGTRTRYVFNISRYVQNFITHRKSDMKLRLSAPYHIIKNTSYTDDCGIFNFPINVSFNEAALGRVRLAGGNHSNPNLKMHLRIIYSKL